MNNDILPVNYELLQNWNFLKGRLIIAFVVYDLDIEKIIILKLILSRKNSFKYLFGKSFCKVQLSLTNTKGAFINYDMQIWTIFDPLCHKLGYPLYKLPPPLADQFQSKYIVGCRGASQLGGSLLGIPLGYKANKL